MKYGLARFARQTLVAVGWMAAGVVLWQGVLLFATSPVSDSFTDLTKIAGSGNLLIDTSAGQVKLAVASTWTCGDALLDSRDGKTYGTVLIDTQCWMAENLNIGTMTAGANTQGTDCPSAAAIEKYCYGNSEDACTSYGGLYQWDQMMCGSTTSGAKGICPTGWHVPTDSEWYALEYYLWDKVTGTCESTRSNVWACSPAGTTLKSGSFLGLLAGNRYTDGSFINLGTYAYFWSSVRSGTNAWYRYLYSGLATVNRFANSKALGFSVRCLKD